MILLFFMFFFKIFYLNLSEYNNSLCVYTCGDLERERGLGCQGDLEPPHPPTPRTSVSRPVQNQNPWKFSTCSVNYFTTFIIKLNQ